MIEIENISVYRGSQRIIDDYSLCIKEGSVLAIMGANGVGKTTLLSVFSGMYAPDSGMIRINARVGFVPQLFNTAFSYSVLDMVLMGRAGQIGLFGAPKLNDYEIARRYMTLLGVSDLERRNFNTLSGGQRQLVMIAQALASECTLLILDEPCSALDYRNQELVITTLQRLNRDFNITIIFSTHAPQHGLEIATEALLMMDSKNFKYGFAADVLTESNLSELYQVEISRADFVNHSGYTFAPRYPGFG